MKEEPLFYLQSGNIFALPILHYNMELAQYARRAFVELKPTCVAVELAESLSLQLLHGASRLPDISVITRENSTGEKIFYLVEPCDAAFEALRSALETGKAAFCIDLDVSNYPQHRDPLPDAYAIQKIGFKSYYELVIQSFSNSIHALDEARELHMAKRLKELSLKYERVLFVGGIYHVARILKLVERSKFPNEEIQKEPFVNITTPNEESLRHIMGEYGWISRHYEETRELLIPLDRQRLILRLFKEAALRYREEHKAEFPGYHLRNVMKFARNYALIKGQLLPDLFEIISAARGCVDDHYAYEVWKLATDYPFYKNVDQLPEEAFTAEQIWGNQKLIRFELKRPSPKAFPFLQPRKNKSKVKFHPPGPFSICSYPPEDIAIENFGKFLQKKGTQIFSEEGAKTIPFSTSLEEGVDTRETIRHFSEKKLYVKAKGKPPQGVGSIVVIFDEDSAKENDALFEEKYPWLTTWIGEHNQESDMAFYATPITANIIGPGIAECEYGGFMMSYPPRRLMDVWLDPDYEGLRSKSEVLLAAAIDYAQKPLIVYVAHKPPRSQLKSFAKRFGKKIIYIPIGQLSPITVQNLRKFHVLDGHDKRTIAGEYIN